MTSEPCHFQVVWLTPPGRGAVASLRLVGEDVARRIAGCCRLASPRPLEQQPLRRILYARFGDEPAEDVVLSRLTPEVIELHCHGGLAALERILGQLRVLGFEALPWESAVAADAADPLAASAQVALAAAPTSRTAVILLDQMYGALRQALEQIGSDLRSGDARGAAARLDELLDRARLGLHLTRPWRVVLVGPPNVGKSSLANALLGYARAIVHPAPGTTRDLVTAVTALEGWPIELVDTAGQREAAEPLEQAGIARAQAAAAEADLVLEVLDAREADAVSGRVWDGGREARRWPPGEAARLRVFNKLDLLPEGAALPPGLAASALTGAGLHGLQQAIVAALVPVTPPPGAAVPFLPEQVAGLSAARAALSRGAAEQAAAALDGLGLQ